MSMDKNPLHGKGAQERIQIQKSMAEEQQTATQGEVVGSVTHSTDPQLAELKGLKFKIYSELSSTKIEPVILCGIPCPKEGLVMLAGDGGVGKSTVAIKMMISYLAAYPEELALFWFTEDHEAIVKERIDKLNLDDKVKSRMRFVATEVRNVNDGVTELQKYSREYGAVVLDPLISFYTGEENSNQEARAFINKVNGLSGLVVLIHHSSKSGETSRGASDFRNGVRMTYLVAKAEIIYTRGKWTRKGEDPNLLGVRALLVDKDNWNIAGETRKTIRSHDKAGYMLRIFYASDKYTESVSIVTKDIRDELEELAPGKNQIGEEHTLRELGSIVKAKESEPEEIY